MTALTDVPAAHTTDPESSYAALDAVTVSGQRATHAALVLRQVRAVRGLTAGELAKLSGLDVVEVRRRLHDLEGHGDVVKGNQRQCREGRNLQLTWWPAAVEPRQEALL